MDTTQPRWHVLNYIKAGMTRSSAASTAVGRYNASNPGADLEVFAPTFVKMVNSNGRVVRRVAPLVYHYIFVRGVSDTVKDFCRRTDGFSPIFNRSGAGRYLTVGDSEMHAFMIIARACSNELPCYTLSEVDLADGDLVEVVDGPFAGLRGYYVPRRGSRHGNIYITANHLLASVVYDVRAQYVRVIEFARDTRRAYDIVDAFVPRLTTALDYAEKYPGEPLPASVSAPLSTFISRMGIAHLPSGRLAGKLSLLLAGAYALLGDHASARVSLSGAGTTATAHPLFRRIAALLPG